MMELIKKAVEGIFDEEFFFKYRFESKYSGKFSDFNANIKKSGNHIWFSLSKRWKEIDEDIVIGLMQSLLLRLFKKNQNTNNIKLYEIFTKNMHRAAIKTDSDDRLIEIFNKLNEIYFYGNMEMPNLRFGKTAISTLGSYNFHNDTITISSILLHNDKDILEYVMYHEMLHKKLKFHTKNGRSFHHTKEFREKEMEFPNFAIIKKKLENLNKPRYQKRRKIDAKKDFKKTLLSFFK